MKIIAHRGNLNGPDEKNENNPSYIQKALDADFDVEIDVWFLGGKLYLGHDKPVYLIDDFWLKSRSNKLWCHAKNLDVIYKFFDMKDINFFWHEHDKMTLTSKGIPWLYPKNFIRNGVTVDLEKSKSIIPDIYGICTDYAKEWL